MSNGQYPIYLVVCRSGRVERTTGISCEERFWDGKREEVKRGCPNAPVLNKQLSDIKKRVIDLKNEYEYQGKRYTASMLLDGGISNDLNGKSNVFRDIMYRLIEERRLKSKTRRHYEYAYRKLVEYIGRKDFLIDEITVGFVKDFCRWLDISDAAKRDLCGSMASVWNYSIDKKLVSRDDYPFTEFRFTQIYKQKFRDYCIDRVNMVKLKDYFLDLVTVRNGSRWTYRDGALDRLHCRSSREFGICYFLCMYYFNGSAPYDVAKLKVSDVSRVRIDGEDYFKLEFKRQKSGTNVSVRLKRNMLSIVLLEHFLGFSSSRGYVYPVIRDSAITEEQIQGNVNKCGESAIKWVRKAFEDINGETINRNVTEGLEEPLVDVQKVVLYSARHSFASNYLNSAGATVMGAASLLARSANTISVYIHSLQNDKEIANAVSFLDD